MSEIACYRQRYCYVVGVMWVFKKLYNSATCPGEIARFGIHQYRYAEWNKRKKLAVS